MTFSSSKVIHPDEGVRVRGFFGNLPDLADENEADDDDSFELLNFETPRQETEEGKPQENTEPEVREEPKPAEPTVQDKLIEEAEKRAEEILEEANQKAEEIRRQAFEDGFRQGLSEGREKGEEEARSEVRAQSEAAAKKFHEDTAQALDEISAIKEEAVRRYLDELRDVAIAVAEKVIHVSLSSSGEVIGRMILNEVEKKKKTAWMKIYIDKQDYDMMVKADADVADALSRVSDNVKFVIMENNPPGSCIIETPEEIVDIGVDTQIANLKDKLDGAPLDMELEEA